MEENRKDFAAAMEAEPAGAAATRARFVIDGCCFGRGCVSTQDIQGVYHQLATLYRQLGRPEAVAVVVKKMRASAPSSTVLASYYESQGQVDEVAAIYKAQIEQAAADPQSQSWQRIQALQQLAWLYQRDGRSSDAVATLQQGIASLEASGTPDARYQANGLRQNLASVLQQAGQLEAAESIYRQLVADTRDDQNHMGYEAGAITGYANFLSSTTRSPQAEALLKDYLGSHGNLQAWEESNLLYALAEAANASGDSKRAADYRLAAEEKQKSMLTPSVPQILIQKDIQGAQAAAGSGKMEEAFTLVMRALDSAPNAGDREQVSWAVPSIAYSLLKSPQLAEQLYQRAFVLLQSWSSDSMQPLLSVLQAYPNFLMQQSERRNDVPEALERYRAALIAARGADTGQMERVLNATIQFHRGHGGVQQAIPVAQELLALEETLSGTTSQPYLNATVTLAELYDSAGDRGRAVQLRSEMIPIADLVYTANDLHRGWIRLNTARGLANQGSFQEAERLVSEAVAIGQQLRPAQPNPFLAEAGNIRQIKKDLE